MELELPVSALRPRVSCVRLVFTIYHFTGGLLGKLTNPNYAQYAATVLKWLFEMECTTADLGNTFNESAEGLIDQFTAGLGYGMSSQPCIL